MYCHPIPPINSYYLPLTSLDSFLLRWLCSCFLIVCVLKYIWCVFRVTAAMFYLQHWIFVISLNLPTLMNILPPFPQYFLGLGEEDTDISSRAMFSKILA